MNDSFTLIQEVTKFGDTVKAKVKSKKKRSSQNKQAEVQLTPQEQQERQEQLRRVYTFNNVAKRGTTQSLPQHPFNTRQFWEFQRDVLNGMADTSYDRLQNFEELVPNIVDTHKDLATRIADMNRQMKLEQRRNQEVLNNITTSLSNHTDHQSQQQALLSTISAQLHHLATSQQALYCIKQT
ncbi:hypothetical protein V8B55DRAFT_1434401 [Mucor lusitanicus]|uniref:Ndc10 domain-containing protein n=1 Tax=Mucor lusitanicus CBS 277.49 TaxID=747725 RepID=A0A162MRP6_MUCCL|nr:hypothetical protein MUCCIDRAFT_108505 [Mucor lusitanicus CBS 277.49]